MSAEDFVVDPMTEVAKWAPEIRAQVTATRAIELADLPADRDAYLRDAWEDDGAALTVNMVKARAAFELHLGRAKLGKAAELQVREFAGENIAAEKAALQAINPTALAAGKATPAALKAAWPFGK